LAPVCVDTIGGKCEYPLAVTQLSSVSVQCLGYKHLDMWPTLVWLRKSGDTGTNIYIAMLRLSLQQRSSSTAQCCATSSRHSEYKSNCRTSGLKKTITEGGKSRNYICSLSYASTD